ncbi:hypothetical protein HU200_007968 [Digitaria exilis]|uniref:Membrane insertase YidC/Oxa/ALB C-terminal domain-containing protein n=1 Tax=Digitaria exilis TaxID=1010633 RepID=A0A835KQI6_9POAL|nr:hypothetical protein HU200_007968 [Digitaria exilis]
MTLAAAARRSLASRLSGCLHSPLPHLLTAHCSGDATATTPSPLHPTQPQFRPPHVPLLPQSSLTAAQTLSLFPFGVHLAGAGPFRRGFSSWPPNRVADAGAVLSDTTAATTAAPASFPSDVAWVTEDSSLSVAALQHLIDAVHSFTGLNWWLSIAVSTVLLRSVLFTLGLSIRKQIHVSYCQITSPYMVCLQAKDEKSQDEAAERLISFFKSLSPLAAFAILRLYTFMALYFAISNMVQKLPSLKEGGAFWFTDLTTPDALYIFPAMISLSLLLKSEFRLHYSKKERRLQSNFVKIFYVLAFPFAASFPTAICCYFMTWSFASIAQMIVVNQLAVKKLLFSKPNEPTHPLPEGLAGSTAEDSPCSADENEQTLPSEKKEASDSSMDQARDQSDKKSEKDN